MAKALWADVLTDAHLKNFGLFSGSPHLTPAYDLVAAAAYPPFQTLAMAIAGAENMRLNSIKPKYLKILTKEFGLSEDVLKQIKIDLEKKLSSALEQVSTSDVGSSKLRNKLCELMEKRWNGTFCAATRLVRISR
jgi:serine/threonine protein kinase HipA of HipAB toxin-antitoxin module